MKITKFGHGLLMALTVALAAPSTAAEVVNVYNWSDYVDPATLKAFEKETGIKVNYDVYDSNEVLEAKLMSGRSGYDVVVPSGQFLERQIKAGIFTKIDRSKLTAYGNLDGALLEKIRVYDEGNQHNVPWAWGSIGLGYNEKMIAERLGGAKLDSYDAIFKPEVAAKLADCGIALLDSPTEVLPIALNYLGLDPHSEKKADLAKAEALLKSVRPHLKYFHSSKYISDLANGEICVALGYNGDIVQAGDRANEANTGAVIRYVVPKEGSLAFFDLMAIPKDAPNPEAAHKFIDFMLRPESGAAISNFVFFAVPNTAALPLVDEAVRNNPAIYLPAESKTRIFGNKTHGAKYDRLATRAWTDIKTGR